MDDNKTRQLRALAVEVSEMIELLSPFIQSHTNAVCPSCQKVCCINRHSYHEYEDILYIQALGEELPVYRDGVDDSAPCRFLDKYGCTIKRSLRPYRCNWFFCTPLLEHIQNIPAPEYRRFSDSLKQLTQKREELLNELAKIEKPASLPL
jgi:hypothetical protein